MYTQEFVDERPYVPVNEVAAMRTKERLALKFFKCKNGCSKCGCLMKTVSTATKKIECSNCLGQFKGLKLPFKQPHKYTIYRRGMNPVKLKPTTVAGVNARQSRNERYTEYLSSGLTNPLPVVFSGMSTV